MQASDCGHYHLVGVAGVGMSALAQALLAEGCAVSGSDRQADRAGELDILRKLRLAGVRLVAQDGSGMNRASKAVVVSTAIEKDNPDVQASQAAAVPVFHRAEMLAKLAEGHRCIAVTGTSGKTTVTGMLGWILEALGQDPTVVNGGAVLNWLSSDRIGNVRIGRSGLWVIEADESDRSLLRYRPDWAIITNMSRDHFPMDETEALFREFRRQVRRGAVGALDTPAACEALRVERTGRGMRFEHGGVAFGVPLPGRHNAENALLAVLLCERLGLDLRRVSEALASFRGIERRLETVGVVNGVTVVDEYAHNTAKIRAAWEAMAPHAKRILAVWRPHGFAPLANMLEDLVALFGTLCVPPHQLYLLPVYYAGGTADRRVGSEILQERLQACGCAVSLLPDRARLLDELARTARNGDAVLVMGARDPDLPVLARDLVQRLTRRTSPVG